jgi:hypothetical protein
MREEEIKEFVDKGPVREVGMGPIKVVDIREGGRRTPWGKHLHVRSYF